MNTLAQNELRTEELTSRVDEFAAAVVERLSDLPEDEVVELTDGLNADLVEALQDSGTEEPSWLDDPQAYADELRAAAGLPARAVDGAARNRAHSVADSFARQRSSFVASVRAFPWYRPVADFLISIKPVWWVLRVFVLWFILSGTTTPNFVGGWLALAATTVVSVNWGRGKWIPTWWKELKTLKLLRVVGILIAIGFTVFGAIFVFLTVNSSLQVRSFTSGGQGTEIPDAYDEYGRMAPETRAFNLYVYDRDGNPVPEARILDEEGEPFSLLTTPSNWSWRTPDGDRLTGVLPFTDKYGREQWNVYPYRPFLLSQADYSATWPKPRSDKALIEFMPAETLGPLVSDTAPKGQDGESKEDPSNEGESAPPTTTPSGVDELPPGSESPELPLPQ